MVGTCQQVFILNLGFLASSTYYFDNNLKKYHEFILFLVLIQWIVKLYHKIIVKTHPLSTVRFIIIFKIKQNITANMKISKSVATRNCLIFYCVVLNNEYISN